MSDKWELKEVGLHISELPKSVIPAGAAEIIGAYQFFCSSPFVRRINRWMFDGDAILMGTGGVATVHFGKGRFSYSTDTWAFTVKDNSMHIEFLFRQLERELFKIDYFGFEGSGLKHLQKDFVRKLQFVAPPLDQQLLVIQVLKTIDTAISQTEAIVEKLKQVRQGLLHDLLTRGVDASGELRSSREEMPHLYKPTALGCIPKDWACGSLEKWLDGKPKNGYSPLEAMERTGIQMLGLGCLTSNGFRPIQLKAAPRSEKRMINAMLNDGDLLISRANTREFVGLVGVYADVGTPCIYPDLMMRLKPSSDTSAEFLQLVLQSSNSRRQIQVHAVGTSESMVKISGQIVSNLLVALPAVTEQKRILERMASWDVRLTAESNKSKALQAIKTGLMDDLLTGRIRVTSLLAI